MEAEAGWTWGRQPGHTDASRGQRRSEIGFSPGASKGAGPAHTLTFILEVNF